MIKIMRLKIIMFSLLLAVVTACGNVGPVTGEEPQEAFSYVHLYDLGIPHQIISDFLYAEQCHEWTLYPCPGDTEWSVYKKQTLIDVCEKNEWGEPTILQQGPCTKILECHPQDEPVDGPFPCVTDDGLPGEYYDYCLKGWFDSGPCHALCFEEVCDGIDNDCDGRTDEGQLNACHECGAVPPEVCNGIDDDCDGKTDEGLEETCTTVCESAPKICLNGVMVCTAKKGTPEVCDGLDNDCNGLIDDGINCGCDPSLEGLLIPCAQPPLSCGWGWTTCECSNPECTAMTMTDCQNVCAYIPALQEGCDPTLPEKLPEICNNWDDNCNELIDEDLFQGCYTAPLETVWVGLCKPGEETCNAGAWGHYNATQDFVGGYCKGEVTPQPEICDGKDNDCDGIADKGEELDDTDLLFVIDMSGSMGNEIAAVREALKLFAASYQDEPALRWGSVLVASNMFFNFGNHLEIQLQPAPFSAFLAALDQLTVLSGGNEMSYDALYLAIQNLSTTAPYPPADMTWTGVGQSNPVLKNYEINWRPEAHKVVVTITDEEGQSYLNPKVTQQVLLDTIAGAEDLFIYALVPPSLANFTKAGEEWGWDGVSPDGLFPLSNNVLEMLSHLLSILDETACQEDTP